MRACVRACGAREGLPASPPAPGATRGKFVKSNLVLFLLLYSTEHQPVGEGQVYTVSDYKCARGLQDPLREHNNANEVLVAVPEANILLTQRKEAQVSQILALQAYKDSLHIGSSLHAGIGQVSLGSTASDRCDYMVCERPGVLHFINYHERNVCSIFAILFLLLI